MIAIAVASSAQAAPVYSVDHFQDTYNSTVHAPGGDIGPQSTPIDYDFPFQSVDGGDRNWGEVYANAGPGSVGIYARAWNNGAYAPQRQEVYASHQFDVVFGSAGTDPINVAMRLHVSGLVQEGGAYGNVEVWVSGPGGTFGGNHNESNGAISQNGLLAGFVADGSDQTITTPVRTNVPVNTPVTFTIGMHTTQGYSNWNPRILFGDTFSLATSGNVFDISGAGASDVTSVDSDDANIVGNQYGSATPCEGDADDNSVVDVNDIAYVIFRLGNTGAPGSVDGDADANGVVDVNDIAYVIFRLGPCP